MRAREEERYVQFVAERHAGLYRTAFLLTGNHHTAQDAAIKRAPDAPVTSSETADLLEALRRRRGQREPLPGLESAAPRSSAPVALFDALEPGYEEAPSEASTESDTGPVSADAASRRKGRTSMPSWDEIVFGARSDDA